MLALAESKVEDNAWVKETLDSLKRMARRREEECCQKAAKWLELAVEVRRGVSKKS